MLGESKLGAFVAARDPESARRFYRDRLGLRLVREDAGALIFVEHESQKGILIGRGGSMQKRIGTAARRELEAFFGVKVFLQLSVAVRRAWRKDERALREFGFLLTS